MLQQHQQDGAAWLAQRARGYLGDAPGAGKTRTLLAAAKACGEHAPLVLCPAAVKSHWRHEGTQLDMQPEPVSFDAAVRGGYPLMQQLLERKPGVLVIDEAHYTQHATSKRSVMTLGPQGYARRVKHVFPASGTPFRYPDGYWTILSSLFPEVAIAHGCRRREQFEAKFCVKRGFYVRGVWHEKTVGVQNTAEFREMLAETMLRREQVGGPALRWQPLMLDASHFSEELPEALQRYRCVRADGQLKLEVHGIAGQDPWPAFLAELSHTPHIARYRQNVGLAKVKPVVALLREELAASDEKVVLFAYHRAVLDAVKEGLACFGVAYVDGDTPLAKRDDERDRFRCDTECRVFVGQQGACGTGMDGLQYAAHRILLLEPSWVAAENDQYGKRLARTGQAAPHVLAQMVSLAGTLDDWIIRQNVREAADLVKLFPVEGM